MTLESAGKVKEAGRKTIAVLQPGYLPWLGFFDQMQRVDVFVLYDNVQFDKHGWRNRNRIKTQRGPQWMTVPVHVSLGQRIVEVQIDNRKHWARKQIASLKQHYSGAAFTDQYLPAIEAILSREWELIVDLDLALIKQFRQWLSIEAEVVRASELSTDGDRNERLLNICRKFNATHYLSGNAAQGYLDVNLFANNGVSVVWQNYSHPQYKQLHGEFVPYLSTIDLLMNCGEESASIISCGRMLAESVTAKEPVI